MEYLYHRGLSTILWECGGTLGAEAIAAGVIQKIWAFIAPKIIGGTGNYSPVGDLGLLSMTQALLLERVTIEAIDRDFLLQGYLPKPPFP
jgi:diaminohydroxyphosphoribosylaminopyrimidine deaminase/5-amino-6-(5-phosphoribosylamino)uracil reductase